MRGGAPQGESPPASLASPERVELCEGRAIQVTSGETLKTREGQESCFGRVWVKLCALVKRCESGAKLQGRSKPERGADPAGDQESGSA